MGYGTTSLPQNVSGDDLAAKVNAFYAYTPYDLAICQTPTACATRPESEWLRREYIVASEDGGTAPGGEPANVAPSATATASSEDVANQETADKAIDGVAAGYPEAPTHEWSTYKGKAGSWLQLVWAEPQVVDSIVLYDRPNPVDQITAGTLTFSDGSEVAFGPLPNDGSSLTVDFAGRTTTGVRLTVTSVLRGTQNVGLSEIEVWSPTAGGPSQASPLAAAGPDQTVASGATVTLDGSQSVDPNGGSLVYAWSQTAGPSVGLSSSSTAAPSFTAPDGPATLTFSLVVFAGRCRARRTR